MENENYNEILGEFETELKKISGLSSNKICSKCVNNPKYDGEYRLSLYKMGILKKYPSKIVYNVMGMGKKKILVLKQWFILFHFKSIY